MVILPLLADGVILSLELSFKNLQQKKEELQADKINLPANDIRIGKMSLKTFEDSQFFDKHPEAITNFIRKSMVNNPVQSVYVTTCNYPNSEFYDIYKLPCPPFKSNPVVDFLYGYLINDLRLKNPTEEKGHEISLKQLGIDNLFGDDFLQDLSTIKNQHPITEEYLQELRMHGYDLQLDILHFFELLNFTVIDQSIMATKNLDNTIHSFAALHGKIEKQLTRYKNLASDNKNSYTILATANHTIYDKPLSWPQLSLEQQKILLKKDKAA